MADVTISSKFQVVIPREVRKRLNLHPGQKLQVLVKENSIAMIPLYPMKELRGSLKGMDVSEIREEEERL